MEPKSEWSRSSTYLWDIFHASRPLEQKIEKKIFLKIQIMLHKVFGLIV
jgi:hypothetical protein